MSIKLLILGTGLAFGAWWLHKTFAIAPKVEKTVLDHLRELCPDDRQAA